MTMLRNPLVNPSPILTRVEWSPVFELLVASWSVAMEHDDLDSFSERAHLEGIVEQAALSGDQMAWLAESHAAVWVAVLRYVDLAETNTIQGLIEFVEDTDLDELYAPYAQAATSCSEHCDHEIAEAADASVFRSRLLDVLRTADQNLGGTLEAFVPTLRHDAEGTRFLQRRMSIEKLIETVTNGIVYAPQAGVEEIVLIPSIAIRPFNLLFRHDRTQYLLYSASDDALDADADTPPSWMVQMFKALGDEKRLRLLRHLAAGPQTLSELVEYLGVAKSTAHHHLRLLRAAGLVRQDISGDKKEEAIYELRTSTLPEAVALVRQYISPEEVS